MKETLKKIYDNYSSMRTEILCMCLFVLLFLILNWGQLTREASAVPANAPEEAGTETERESESESETEREVFTAAELAAGRQAGGSEETGDAETASGSSGAAQADSQAAGQEAGDSQAAGQETGDSQMVGQETGDSQAAGQEADTQAAGQEAGDSQAAGQEADTQAAGQEAGDSQAADQETEDAQDALQRRLLTPVSADFRIPMAMSELTYAEDESAGLLRFGAPRSFELLRRMVERRIAEYDGSWSVYAENLRTGESFAVNDQPMKSASVMKLFVMGTVYEAFEDGGLERTDETVSLLHEMITVSDNEATNRLLYLLGDSSYADGIGKVNDFIQSHGFSEMTVEYNGFNDSETVINPGFSNQVSARDCGKLLEDIYRRTWMNRSAANEMEQLLLDQQTRYKIPAGLPEGVACGNKTGEMDTTENDAAVVYAQDCDYILVVLSSDWSSKDEAIARIASMSAMVYDFLS